MPRTQKPNQKVTLVGASFETNNTIQNWYGNKISKQTKQNIIKIGFQNIGNLPKEQKNHKSTKLVSYMIQKEFDIFGVAEVKLNWSKVEGDGQ